MSTISIYDFALRISNALHAMQEELIRRRRSGYRRRTVKPPPLGGGYKV